MQGLAPQSPQTFLTGRAQSLGMLTWLLRMRVLRRFFCQEADPLSYLAVNTWVIIDEAVSKTLGPTKVTNIDGKLFPSCRLQPFRALSCIDVQHHCRRRPFSTVA